MAYEDLSENDIRLYEYINMHDFETHKWSTPAAADALGMTEEEVRESMVSLIKNYSEKVYFHYEDGGIRISSE